MQDTVTQAAFWHDSTGGEISPSLRPKYVVTLAAVRFKSAPHQLPAPDGFHGCLVKSTDYDIIPS